MHQLLSELRSIDLSPAALRRFGYWVGGVLLALGLLLIRFRPPAGPWLAAVGVVLIAVGAAMPVGLRPLYRIWMSLALLLGHLVGTVLLILIFYLVFTPIGCLARLCGKDFLRQRPDPGASTWWLARPPRTGSETGYDKQG